MSRDLIDYQAKYQSQPFERIQVAYRKKNLVAGLSRFLHRSILEVGCGLAPLFEDFTDFDRLAVVEPGEVFFREAQNSLSRFPGRDKVKLVHGYLADAGKSLSGENFDFIILSSLLHEVPDPGELLRQARALCGKDTVVHVNVPNARSFHRLLAREMGLISDVHEKSAANRQFQQNSVFDEDSLALLLKKSGFEILDSGSYFIKPFTHSQMESLVEQGLLTSRMLDGLYALSQHLPKMGSEIFVHARVMA